MRGGSVRPLWRDLHSDDVLAQFRPNEVLQLYHLEATERIFERGGLNHDLSFQMTALGFQSMENPDSKVGALCLIKTGKPQQ